MDDSLKGKVAIVTGGGSGIGRAVAIELARQGARVVVADPGVGAEGEPLGEPTAAETAGLISKAGGEAWSSAATVTEPDQVAELFAATKERYGVVDVVVNPAGIVNYRKLPDTSEADWASVLDVHVNGYINVLRSALTLMVEQGHGRLVGFTSGVGVVRSAGDAMIYGAAKRAVAALTWELGPLLPDGIGLNALSPIAATRMVRSALVASGAGPRGLDLSNMPQPENMAPAAAYLSGSRLPWCQGQVIFSAGSELTHFRPPRILEAVRTEDVGDIERMLATVMPVVLSPVQAGQATTGGTNPRFGDVFGAAPAPLGAGGGADPGSAGAQCLVVGDQGAFTESLRMALQGWSIASSTIEGGQHDGVTAVDFDAASAHLEEAAGHRPVNAVIVVSGRSGSGAAGDAPSNGWAALLDAQSTLTTRVIRHGAWLRAAARHGRSVGHSIRVVHVCLDASGVGRPAAQAMAQLARSACDSSLPVGISSYSISVESAGRDDLTAAAHLAARLSVADDAPALERAELVVGQGWLGLRSHPRPSATISFGGPAIPSFVDAALREAVLQP